MSNEPFYFQLSAEPAVRTIEVKPVALLVDVDAEGRAVGIETLGNVLTLDDAVAVIRQARFEDAS